MLAEYRGEVLRVGKIWPKPQFMTWVYVGPHKGVREMYFRYCQTRRKGLKEGFGIFLLISEFTAFYARRLN
jgi:hypothetical protein